MFGEGMSRAVRDGWTRLERKTLLARTDTPGYMSNGDDEADAEDAAEDEAVDVTADELETRLD